MADRLWPDLDEATGRNNLRLTLQYLKGVLEEHGLILALDVDRYELRLRADAFDLDIRDLTLMTVDGLRQQLLPNLYDSWLESYREKVEQSRAEALWRVAESEAEAVEALRILAEMEPYSERVYLRLAERLADSGLEAEAYAELSALRTRVRADLHAEASAVVEHALVGLKWALVHAEVGSNYPKTFSRFFGRTAELTLAEEWLGDPELRLLTLAGMGGIGKTTLATKIAELSERANYRVLWMDAEDVVDAASFRAYLEKIAFPGEPIDDYPRRLRSFFRKRKVLLVVDNLENLADRDRTVLDETLRLGSDLKILVTSRKAFALPGERLCALSALDPESDALAMFTDRVRAIGMATESLDRTLMIEICEKVDGIPLAIELAASRLAGMDLSDLHEGLKSPLSLLIDPVEPKGRHGTLRSVLAWSFDSLPSDRRDDLLRLSILRGQWTTSLARACVDSPEVVLELGCRYSILQRQATSPARFRMLESTRRYSEEVLTMAVRREVMDRLNAHFARVVETISTEQLELNWPTLEMVLEDLASRGDPAFAGWLMALSPTLINSALTRSALALIERNAGQVSSEKVLAVVKAKLYVATSQFASVLDLTEGFSAEPALEVEALALRSFACVVLGRVPEAVVCAKRSLELAERSDNLRLGVRAHLALVIAQYAAYDAEVLAVATRAAELAAELGDVTFRGHTLHQLASVQTRLGMHREAYSSLRAVEALKTFQVRKQRVHLYCGLAKQAWLSGDLKESEDKYRQAMALVEEMADDWFAAQVYCMYGDFLYGAGRLVESLDLFRKSLEFRRDTGARLGIATSCRGIGRAVLALGDAREAASCFETAVELGFALDDRPFLVTVLLPLAQSYVALNRENDARVLCQQVLDDLAVEAMPRHLIDLPDMDSQIEFARCLVGQR